MTTQLTFVDIMEDVEAAERARADAHRQRTQQFFDSLPNRQRNELAELFHVSEWVTCQALSAAAGAHRSEERPS